MVATILIMVMVMALSGLNRLGGANYYGY